MMRAPRTRGVAKRGRARPPAQPRAGAARPSITWQGCLRERRRARMTYLVVSRRHFLKRAGWQSLGAAAILGASGRRPARAQGASSYPDFVAPSAKPPRRGGVLARTTAWDPPVLDPRLTN